MKTPATPSTMAQNPSMHGITAFVSAKPQHRFQGWETRKIASF
ncbi:MAG: hypothetical protein AAGA87_07285 [Pseudomonadota bacterium]